MHTLARVYLRYTFFQYFGTIDIAAGSWHPGNENLGAILFENFLDPSPVSDLQRSNCGSYGDGVEPEEAVAEYNGILCRII